ncbi:MAG: hypothetical protein JSR61_09205 [Proteobacteria bacterium]|nr:hypothetical protein [Pseudomonadota bacterium]
MRQAHTRDVDVGGCAGGGFAAPGIARLLGFAAMPVFALMALWTRLSGGPSDMLCMAMQGPSPFNSMATMYALMSVFHAAPWLRLLQRR